jgi:hypothetical protein
MPRFDLDPSARRVIAPALLLVAALGASAQTPPVTRAPMSSVQAPAPKPPPSPIGAAPAPTSAPVARGKLPDLVFAYLDVNGTHYIVGTREQPIAVAHSFPPPASGAKPQQSNPCNRSFTFPVVLTVKNIGTADFVPLGSAQAVGLDIGPFNSAKDLIKLAPGAKQVMSFNVTLPAGNYTLAAMIDLHGQVAESNTNNDKLNWPLKVVCEIRSNISTAPAPIKNP